MCSSEWYCSKLHNSTARCLKIINIVSYNIASEASYFYTLSGQKFIKNAKIGSFWRVIFKHCDQHFNIYTKTFFSDYISTHKKKFWHLSQLFYFKLFFLLWLGPRKLGYLASYIYVRKGPLL